MAGSQGRRKVRHRLTPDEMFEELGELKTEIELCLYAGDEDDVTKIDENEVVSDFTFFRNNLEDLRPDPDVVEDDLVVNAAIYARYGFMYAKVCRFRDRVKREWLAQRGKVFRSVSLDVYNDPDIPPKAKTKEYIDTIVDATASVRVFATAYDDAEEAVAIVRVGMKAMEMKHDNCVEIDRSRRKEAGLIGSTYVRSKVSDDETEENEKNDRGPFGKHTGRGAPPLRERRERVVKDDEED